MMDWEDCHQSTKGCSDCWRRLSACKCDEETVQSKCPCGSSKIGMLKCKNCRQSVKGCDDCLRRLSSCSCDDSDASTHRSTQEVSLSSLASTHRSTQEVCLPSVTAHFGAAGPDFFEMLKRKNVETELKQSYPEVTLGLKDEKSLWNDRFRSLERELAAVKKQNADMECKLASKSKTQKLATIQEEPHQEQDLEHLSECSSMMTQETQTFPTTKGQAIQWHCDLDVKESKDDVKSGENRDQFVNSLKKQMAISMKLNANLINNFKKKNAKKGVFDCPELEVVSCLDVETEDKQRIQESKCGSRAQCRRKKKCRPIRRYRCRPLKHCVIERDLQTARDECDDDESFRRVAECHESRPPDGCPLKCRGGQRRCKRRCWQSQWNDRKRGRC